MHEHTAVARSLMAHALHAKGCCDATVAAGAPVEAKISVVPSGTVRTLELHVAAHVQPHVSVYAFVG